MIITYNPSQVTGLLVDTKSTFCSSKSSLPSHLVDISSFKIAVVLRGECKFSKKAENAAREEYQGVIILDTMENTNVDRISGVRSLITDNIPVVFLLQNEALILRDLLKESPNRTATISGYAYIHVALVCLSCVRINVTCESCCVPPAIHLILLLILDSSTFSWFKRPFTPSTTTATTISTNPSTSTTTKTSTTSEESLLVLRRFPPFFGHKKPNVFHKSQSDTDQDAAVLMISDKTERRGIIEVTPLTIGAISVGVVVCILLIISVITLIVSKVRKQSRRRIQNSRCQQAIRQFDAMNRNFGKENTGYSPDGANPQTVFKSFPKSTYSLLECPVCLEIAWPPKKIFQCREGHIICDTCKANPNLKNCPMCRTPLSNHLISRNRFGCISIHSRLND